MNQWLGHLFIQGIGLCVIGGLVWLARVAFRRDAITAYRLAVGLLLASVAIPLTQFVVEGGPVQESDKRVLELGPQPNLLLGKASEENRPFLQESPGEIGGGSLGFEPVRTLSVSEPRDFRTRRSGSARSSVFLVKRLRDWAGRDWSRVRGGLFFALLYGLGMVFRLGVQGFRLHRAVAFLARCRPVKDAETLRLWARICRSSRLRGAIGIRESDEVRSPVCWAGRPSTVVVPACPADEEKRKALEWALRHELIHLERRDGLVVVLQFLATTLFWFHPVAWWLSREIDRLRELSCDQEVVRRTGRKKSYALALMEYAASVFEGEGRGRQGKSNPALIHWFRSASQLRRRIEMLEHSEKDSPLIRRVAGSVGVAVILAGVAASQMAMAAALIVPLDGDRTNTPAVGLSGSYSGAQEIDPDRDGDGLSDFQEAHKYFTDPDRADSDGDGIPDGDWSERREFSYTVRSLIHVLAPYNKDAFNDDYQDARVLDEADDYIELEVVHYPLNTCGESIVGNPSWRQDNPAFLKEYLEPGVTTNWDPAMKRDLERELGEAGIDLKSLTDLEVVKKLSDWVLDNIQSLDMFTTYSVHYPNGRPEVHPAEEEKFHASKGDPSWSVEEQLQHDVYGRGMFYHKTRGTCTSSANLITTVMRAVGIPTRMIVTIPVVDASDEAEVALLRSRIHHHRVRKTIVEGVTRLGSSFAAHTFNEVWVSGRWRRLNFNRLGQNILDRAYFGLLTHVHTFNDLSEAGLIGWGTRKPNSVFRNSNPYCAMAVSDHFGVHAAIANPTAAVKGDHRELTISKLYWLRSGERKSWIGVKSFPEDGSGHVLVHVDDFHSGEGMSQYETFYENVDKRFVLKARGKPEIPIDARRGYWVKESDESREFYLQIDAQNLQRMAPGVKYKLYARNSNRHYRWKVKPGVFLERPDAKKAKTPHQKQLTISKVYWMHSSERPDWIDVKSFPRDGSGHLLVHVDEFVRGKGSEQYLDFYNSVDKRFRLEAKGHPDIQVTASRGFWIKEEKGGREFYLQVDKEELKKMVPGVRYRLRAVNGKPDASWKIKKRVTIRLEKRVGVIDIRLDGGPPVDVWGGREK